MDKYSFEEAGISEDVIKLSNFISRYIHKKGKKLDTYIITKKEIPDDINLPINVLTITYDTKHDKTANGWVDLKKCKRFKSGNVEVSLTVKTLKKSVLYHEINHILQFINLGRSRMVKDSRLSLIYNNHGKKFEDKKIKYFLYLLYRIDNNEMSSNVIQVYGQLKGLMKKQIKQIKIRHKGISDKAIQIWKNRYFDDTLENRETYKLSKRLEEINLTDYFKETDKEELRRLFGLISSIDRGTFKYKYKSLGNLIKTGELFEMDENPLTDDEVKKEMDKYQTIMNKKGKIMSSRIEKIKYLL